MICRSVLFVAILVVQSWTMETCSAKDLGLSRLLGTQGVGEPKSDFNCYDHYGHGYVGDIPHPSDCRHYLSCSLNFDGVSVPSVMPCNENLQFHLETCRCEWPDASKCFQAGHDYYESNRLRCAEKAD